MTVHLVVVGVSIVLVGSLQAVLLTQSENLMVCCRVPAHMMHTPGVREGGTYNTRCRMMPSQAHTIPGGTLGERMNIGGG